MVTTRPPKTIVKPTALGPVANTDTKLLIYGLFRKGRVLAQDGTRGGHSATTRRALAAMANETPGNGAPAESVSAGTHLVREWNGRTYQVEVLDNGYRFDGKTYPSLTTITKRITGTHWSGPRFFGLTPKRKA